MNDTHLVGKAVTDWEKIFHPRRIAVIGVSSSGAGFGSGILYSLRAIGFSGEIFPVNPKGGEILGETIYTDVLNIPGRIDFAIIAVAAHLVPGVLTACRDKGAAGAEILSSGFSETGDAEGKNLEEEIKAIASGDFRVIGPNCFGIYCPKSGLTVLPGPDLSRKPGPIAFLSQSGGMAVDFANIGKSLGIGFSKVISFGNGADLRETELLNYLADDPDTGIICMYIEGVDDGDAFFYAMKRATARKPVIVIKGGLSESGGRAVASHTASLGGSRRIWRAVLRQAGAVQVSDINEMAATALAFAMLPEKTFTSISVSGGGGALGVAAGDAAEEHGIRIPAFAPELAGQIEAILPRPGSSAGNPIDVANPFVSAADLEKILLLAATDPRIELQVFISLLHHYTTIAQVTEKPLRDVAPWQALAEAFGRVGKESGKPVVVVFANPKTGREHIDVMEVIALARRAFTEQGIPVFNDLRECLRAIGNTNRGRGKPAPQGTEGPRRDVFPDSLPESPQSIIRRAVDAGQEALNEFDSKRILSFYGIPTVPEILATHAGQVETAVREIGFPLVMKGCSSGIRHKTERNLISLSITGSRQAMDEYHRITEAMEGKGDGVLIQAMADGKRELAMGMTRDPQFGPCVMFGLGGIFAEVLDDVAFRKAPLNSTDAIEMMREISGRRILGAVRGLPPADENATAGMLAAIGRIGLAFDEVAEIDINPVILTRHGPIAADALIILCTDA